MNNLLKKHQIQVEICGVFDKTPNGEIRLLCATPETTLDVICKILLRVPTAERKKVLEQIPLIVKIE